MRLLDWLRDRLSGSGDYCFPAMLRVRDASGQVVPLVEMDCTFAPSGHRVQRKQVTASGLCMVEWPLRARRAVLALHAHDQSATVEISSQRDDPERVIEVRLA